MNLGPSFLNQNYPQGVEFTFSENWIFLKTNYEVINIDFCSLSILFDIDAEWGLNNGFFGLVVVDKFLDSGWFLS